MRSDLVRDGNGTASKNELLRDVTSTKKRLQDYDWNYRLNRFDEKIRSEKVLAENILKKIELSDNIK